MERIDKQAVLHRTHYGIGIYSHILRECFPEDEIVMRLSGRDCGLCRNPFAEGASTLHIFIEKSDPANAMSTEYAKHTTTDHSIPDGDAFAFAELHYHQSGEELLATLNRELNLHIGEDKCWYARTKNDNLCCHYEQSEETSNSQLSTVNCQLFSFFYAPVTNTKPSSIFTLLDAYNYIIGNTAKERTEKLRSILQGSEVSNFTKSARMFKAANFDYCTFSGTFTTRTDKALIQHSGLLCIDFDHLQNLDSLRSQLLQDEYFDTQLLFRSPSGDGLKWIVALGSEVSNFVYQDHAKWFTAIANYLFQTYGVEADKSGKDISRACFLPHDPNCFINPNLLTVETCRGASNKIQSL